MLKPFQIRDLHDPSFQPDTSGPPSCCDSSQDITSGESSHSADWYRPSRDHITEGGVNHSGGASPEHHISDSHFERSRPGVVQISAREYDETIASHPHSSLMYMDDDDGETVTVGSSFELSQRLDEPIDSSASLSSLTGSHSPYQMVSNPVHIFDIRRSRSTVELWRSFEKRTFDQLGASQLVGPSSPRSSVVGTLSTGSPRSPEATNPHPNIDSSSGLADKPSQRDIRADWLQACEPPQFSKGTHGPCLMSSENPFASDSDPKEDDLNVKEGDSMTRSRSSPVKSPCSITEEGKRQAQEAGARFRNWKRVPSNDLNSSTLTSTQTTNPWSSYTKSQVRLDDPPSQSISQTNLETEKASSAAEDESQPLLAAFEAQMSKIMEAKATAERHSPNENNSDNDESHPDPIPSATTEPFTSNIRPPPSPVDVLAQAVNHMVIGATRLSTELSHRLPEIERQLSNAPGRLPDHMEATVQGGLRTIGSHIQVLANSAQDASVATRQAAERTRTADHHVVEQIVAQRLRGVAGDLSQIGRSIFSSLEAGLGASRSNVQAESAPKTAQPTETPRHETGAIQINTDSRPEPSGSSALENEKGSGIQSQAPGTSSCLIDAVQKQAHQAVAEQMVLPPKLDTNPASAPISSDRPTSEPRKPPGSFPDATSNATPDYPKSSRQANPSTTENARPSRQDRSRSPSSFRQPQHRNFWAQRGPTNSMPWQNPQPYTQPKWIGRQWPPSGPRSFPFSSHPWFNAADPRPNPQEPTAIQDTLFLGIPGISVTDVAIRNLLAEQGFLAKVHLPMDSKLGSHVGFAYLKFPSIYAAKAAKEALQGAHLGGKAVNVEFSHGVNFDALQIDASRSNFSRHASPTKPGNRQTENFTAARPPAPPALRRRPVLGLADIERNKTLKSKPSVTFADSDNTANAAKSIKRHRSLGALPLASGGPFPYKSPLSSSSSKPLNNRTILRKDENLRDDDTEYVTRTGSSQNTAEAEALLDQEDTDPEFSARYPSLLATRDLRRANTVSSAATQNSLGNPPVSLESEMARFPPVSQIEAQSLARHQSDLQSKPPVPSNQGPRLSARGPGVPEPGILRDTNVSDRLPGSWPQETSDTPMPDLLEQLDQAEGGNDAFKDRKNLFRSNSLVSADPAARLTGPFDPDNERRWEPPVSLPKRSATERRPSRPPHHTLQFDRSYRVIGDKIAPRSAKREEPSWETYLDHPKNFLRATSPPQHDGARTAQPEMSQRTVTERTRSSEPPAHSSSKIEACVEHLKALGFHKDGEENDQRLRVYACAVDGSLGDAIEMIEEERKAYEQRPSLV